MKIGDIFDHRKDYLDLMLKKRRNSPEVEQEIECKSCKSRFNTETLRKNLYICPDCGRYMTMPPAERIALIADDGNFREMWSDAETVDPISFPDYRDKLARTKKKSGAKESVVTGTVRIYGQRAAVAVLDTSFFMGSMGTVLGEKITRLTEYADRHRMPLIIFSASGGARMQEGLFSLMQMAKTSAAIENFKENGGLYISVLCHPTTGGVSASFAMLGDIILAEPKALIGFAGSRVIEQTVGESVPDEVRQSEAQLKNGMIDAIVERRKLKKRLGRLIVLHQKHSMNVSREETIWEPLGISAHTDKTAYELVGIARDKDRPKITEYIDKLFDGFTELKGDRLGSEDGSILGGIAFFHGMPVTVIGHRKGHDTEENRELHFGMASPEGYRKAMRLAKEAEKFNRPIICFVDTPGAYPGLDAELHGQPGAIAESLAMFSSLTVPVISIVTGEGGSGGALALSIADEIWMLENAVYSILSPEGFAAILWKDAKRAAEASELMRMTSREILKTGIIDGVLPEGEDMYDEMDRMLVSELSKLTRLDKRTLVSRRYEKYRSIGNF